MLLGLLLLFCKQVSAVGDICPNCCEESACDVAAAASFGSGDESGLLQTGRHGAKSAVVKTRVDHDIEERHYLHQETIKDKRPAPKAPQLIAKMVSGNVTPTGDNKKTDKVVEILVPGANSSSSIMLRILNPERIDAQKAVNDTVGSVVKVENDQNKVLKATSISEDQRTIYDGVAKHVAQSSTKLSIAPMTGEEDIQDLEHLLAKARQLIWEVQQNMSALKSTTRIALAGDGRVRMVTLAKNRAEKRLEQLASDPGSAHASESGVAEAAKLAKRTLKLDNEKNEERKSARAAAADRQAVASRMAIQLALAAKYSALGYAEAAESTEGAQVDLTHLAKQFREEPMRVAELRAKLARLRTKTGGEAGEDEEEALARTVVKVRLAENAKLGKGDEAPAGSVMVIDRPASVSTRVDEGTGKNVVTIQDPEDIFVGGDWNAKEGTVNDAVKVKPMNRSETKNISSSVLGFLEIEHVESPNLTDLQEDLKHSYDDIRQAETLAKELLKASQQKLTLAKKLAKALSLKKTLSAELQRYVNLTADLSRHVQSEVLESSDTQSGVKPDLGKDKGNISWQLLDEETASSVVNQSVSVQETSEKVATLATNASLASVKVKTLQRSLAQVASKQRALAKEIEAQINRAMLATSLSLDNLGKCGAEVNLTIISRPFGDGVVGKKEVVVDLPPVSGGGHAEVVQNLTKEYEDINEKHEQNDTSQNQDGKEDEEATRGNVMAMAFTGIIILVLLMLVAMLYWPFTSRA